MTGTLTGGTFNRGQIVSVQPGIVKRVSVRIQSHGPDLESAEPGMRTAINLPDVAPDQIKRGDVLTSLDLGLASSTLMVLIEKSSRRRPMDSFMSHMQHKIVPTGNAAACRLRNGISVYLHHGTSRVAAKVASLEDAGLARLRLASPVFAFLGDRFVIRDPSEQHTIAGGVIVDPEGTKSLPFSAEPDAIDICLRSEIEERGFVQKKTLLRKSHFSASEIVEALGRLERANEIVTRGGIAADTNAWKKLRDQATVLIDLAHKRNPERAGLDLNELRTELRNLPGQAFEALISVGVPTSSSEKDQRSRESPITQRCLVILKPWQRESRSAFRRNHPIRRRAKRSSRIQTHGKCSGF